MTKKELCKETYAIGDDYGDNSTTFTCGEDKGHELPHREKFIWEGQIQPNIFTWYGYSEKKVEEDDDEDKFYDWAETLPHLSRCPCFDCLYPKWAAKYQFDNKWRKFLIFQFNTVGMNEKLWIFKMEFKLWKLKVDWAIEWQVRGDTWAKVETGDALYWHFGPRTIETLREDWDKK